MNADIYLFGKLADDKYFQYPNDYTKSIFQDFQMKSHTSSQILIHRKNNDLVYYTYMRKLDNSTTQYIGICIVINGFLLQDINRLFKIFEDEVGNIVTNSKILKLDIKGEIIAQDLDYSYIQNEYNRCHASIQTLLGNTQLKSVQVPPINNAISATDTKYYRFDDPNLDIAKTFGECNNIIITKGTDFDTSFLATYKANLKRLQEEKENVVQKNEELTKELSKVRKAKERSNVIIALVIILFTAVFVGYNTVLKKDKTISDKETEIAQKKEVITQKEDVITQRENDIRSLKVKQESYRTTVDDLKTQISKFENQIDSISAENNILKIRNDGLIDINNTLENNNENLRTEVKGLKNKNENLITEVKELQKQLESLTIENRYLHREIAEQSQTKKSSSRSSKPEKSSKNLKRVMVKSGAPLMDSPEIPFSKTIKNLSSNDEVFVVQKYSNIIYYVKVGNDYGYIYKSWIEYYY